MEMQSQFLSIWIQVFHGKDGSIWKFYLYFYKNKNSVVIFTLHLIDMQKRNPWPNIIDLDWYFVAFCFKSCFFINQI